MILKRAAQDRGHGQLGWLDTHHSFSFGSYVDPEHVQFRALRVLNDDIVQPRRGFGTHGHDNMEIVTYVVEGALEHRDSMGQESVLRPGDVQRMSAGRGITHSELNHSSTELLRLLQIWILPSERDLEPSYEERHFDEEARRNRLRVIVSPDGREGSLHIHQDAGIHAALLEPGASVEHAPAPGRHAWIQMVRGRLRLNGLALQAGDGAAVSDESKLTLIADHQSEVLLFDLP